MALDYSRLNFYTPNTLRALKAWELLSGASVSGENIVINSGGYAGHSLSDNIARGLSCSLYRALRISLTLSDPAQLSNSINSVELVLRGVLSEDTNNPAASFYKSVNFAPQGGTLSGTKYTAQLVLPMPNRAFTSLQAIILNHSNASVTVTAAALYRSQDIDSGQIGDAIGFGVTLAGFISYTDGFQVFYDGQETPDSAWFMTDNDGNFTGVNWNNERLITYEHRNEALVI